MRQFIPLSAFLQEYSERNSENRYRPVAVGRQGIRSRDSIYSKELAKDYSKNKLIYKNTLTVGMGSVQIDIGILTDDTIYSVSPAYHTYKINGINADYLKYCLECRNQDMFVRFVKRGSRQGKSVDLKRWITYKIPVWDEGYQKKIVTVLDKVAHLIEERHKQLLLMDELIRSRFIEMFGDPKNNNKEWPIKSLDKLCTVRSSKRIYQSEQSSKGVPFWRVSDLVSKMETGVVDSTLFISEIKYAELKRDGLVPAAGDILVTSRGTLGRCYIIQEEDCFYFQDGMISWLSNYSEEIIPLYLQYLFTMSGFRKQIDNMQAGSTVTYLSIAMLKKLQVMVPAEELQTQFADFVAGVDKSKYCHEKCITVCHCVLHHIRKEWFR